MEQPKQITETGGRFLVTPITDTNIFTREDFTEEQREIQEMVQGFCKEHIAPVKEDLEKKDKDLTFSLLRKIAELGLLGITVPEKYGGMELDKITGAIVAEASSYSECSSFVVTWSTNLGIGSLPIIWFGTPAQKEKYLPRLIDGTCIGAYGLTEPSAGSDALSAKTTAVLSEDGKHYILNGEKVFITNGGWADVFTVFAKVDGEKFTAFIVEKDTPGFTQGPEYDKMGMRGSSTTPLIFQNAEVPVENLLYEVGKGHHIAFNVLNMGRFKMSASLLGGSKLTTSASIEYILERRQFGKAIAQFDTTIGKVADMVVETFSADCMTYRTIGMIQDAVDELDNTDPNYYIMMGEAMEKYAIESSMAKVYCSELNGKVIDSGLQMMGGYGFIEEYTMARLYRDCRIDRIWEGTNEINRQIITGYMMKKALMEELPIQGAIREIEQYMNNGKLETDSEILFAESNVVETSKRLALFLLNEGICEFGQDLKHQQQIADILANIFIDIYVAESTVLRAKKMLGNPKISKSVEGVAKIFVAEMAQRMVQLAETALKGIYNGELSPLMHESLNAFRSRMYLPTNTIGLKREIAAYAYSKKSYPY
ncbi:MAG: acyl-CoA dehydrogenase family protein [Candidatus Neomarinimicrobiota bacterium]